MRGTSLGGGYSREGEAEIYTRVDSGMRTKSLVCRLWLAESFSFLRLPLNPFFFFPFFFFREDKRTVEGEHRWYRRSREEEIRM